MSSFKKIFGFAAKPDRDEANSYRVYVRCKRCGEKIYTRVNLSNDLSAEYDGENTFYNCRKVLIGEGRCYQQIEVHLKFDGARKLLDQEISGGEFISAAEFSAQESGK